MRARFIMASTGNVYDADATRPALETDACSPTAAYGASKVAAEQLLRDSDLTSAILRLPFVCTGRRRSPRVHPHARPALRPAPGATLSVAHHRDIAAAVRLALTGVMDGRIVNLTDDAPVTGAGMRASGRSTPLPAYARKRPAAGNRGATPALPRRGERRRHRTLERARRTSRPQGVDPRLR